MRLIPLILLLCSGCSFKWGAKSRAQQVVTQNAVALKEESTALTTAIVDVLSVAPTNRHSEIALTLARHDQQIEGIPLKRIQVEPLIAYDKDAVKSLEARFSHQGVLISEKTQLEAKLRESEASLIEMGRLYEAEKNQNIVKRVWRWAISSLGIGGVVLAFILCPALIPLVGQFFGWLVSKLPKLAGLFGVVSKKAFDGVVLGVGKVREELKKGDAEKLALVDTELQKATDAEHRKLIDARRDVLRV